jgi:hypothetical protein
MAAYLRNRQRWIAWIKKVRTLPVEQRNSVMAVMNDLLNLLLITFWIEGLRKFLTPNYILGAIEKSAYCTLLNEVVNRNNTHHCHIINIQHGVVADDALLECLDVSAFLVWDEATREAISSRRDFPVDRLFVIGRESDPSSSQINKESLSIWKQDNTVLLGCLQPLSAKRQKRFIRPLLTYLQVNPDALLLIRLHPRQSLEDIAVWWSRLASELKGRIKVTSANEFSLNDCLAVAEIVCSDYSSALIDAFYAGKPVLSIYTEKEFDKSICAYFQALGIPMIFSELVTPEIITESMKLISADNQRINASFSEQLLNKALIRIKEAEGSNFL